MSVPLALLAEASRDVAALSGRLDKVERLAAALTALPSEWASVGVSYLAGDLPQGRIGVGYRTLEQAMPDEAAETPSLTLEETHDVLGRVAAASGPGSTGEKTRLVADLLRRATPLEQDFLARLLLGELRQGAQESVIVEAVARATGTEAAHVRRAVMLHGDAAAVGEALLAGETPDLGDLGLQLFRPVKPMLAQGAEDVADAVARLGEAGFEWKFDGARVQVHKAGDDVRIFTRRLNDETDALPDLVEAVRTLPARELVLDGEALALRPDGTPRPFQETMRRFGRVRDVEAVRDQVPLSPFFFDLLWLDGASLLDTPAGERWRALDELVPEGWRSPRLRTDDAEAAAAFLREARARGHEGLMAKDPASTYVAGRRGAGWLKVKPTFTADMIVTAAEWGSGRRTGWLSNLHLAVIGDAPGELVMVGKTFKGMTDALLRWQTERLQELEVSRTKHVVRVRPELVVEIAFDGLQRSPRYPGGLALRFARVRGYREDKPAAEADTIATLRELHERWG